MTARRKRGSDPRSDHELPLSDARSFDAKEFEKHVEAFERSIPPEVARLDSNNRAGLKLLARLRALVERLINLTRALDPIAHSDLYDPSHPESAAEIIAAKLGTWERKRLTELAPFYGAGVYALYYTGDHPAYAYISAKDIPIYVGKADPKTPNAASAREQGPKLYERLFKEHAKSVRQAEAWATSKSESELAALGVHVIRLADFEARFIPILGPYPEAVERRLIAHYRPVWNKETGVCVGFGKHGDKAERRSNTRSDWDTLHPGRPWATAEDNTPNPLTPTQIQDLILKHTAPRD